MLFFVFFFKQKTAYEMRISDWSSDVCSSDLETPPSGMARHTFKVSGLDCAEEVAILKREIGPLVGGADHLAFDVLNGRMMVLKAAEAISPADMRKTVERHGRCAEEWRPGDAPDGAVPRLGGGAAGQEGV